MRWIILSLALILGGCMRGDAGCTSYGIARAEMPRPIPGDELGYWVVDLDDRMTGTCR